MHGADPRRRAPEALAVMLAIAGQMLAQMNHLMRAANVLIAARECLRASALICAAALEGFVAKGLSLMC